MDPSASQKKKKIGLDIVFRVIIFAFALALVICLYILPLNVTSPYIEDLYVPALNKTTTFNSSVFVNLKFKRKAAWTRHGFPKFHMRLIYIPYQSRTSLQVGEQEVQGFIMGRHTRVHVKVAVKNVKMPWEEASRSVSSGKEVMVVVQLKMPENLSWVASVAVDASSHMVSKKPIKFECRPTASI